MRPRGRVGIWSGELRFLRDRETALAAAVELEELGYGTLWLPGGVGTGAALLAAARQVLERTGELVVATGILSIWSHSSAATSADVMQLRADFPDRFLLGLGVSHPELLEPGTEAPPPLTAMRRYLDELDRSGGPPPEGRLLAALGPRMLELASERAAGAHPYLVTPAHTAFARSALGPDPVLAPEQGVVLESDPDRAREIAREHLATYLKLPNYTRNLLRQGFEPMDLEDGGSDRLVDELIAWGDEDMALEGIRGHLEAGADHVAVQVLSGRRGELALPEWRRLASLLARVG